MMPMESFFSRRSSWRQETNAFNKVLEELQAQSIPVIDLTASNPTSCGFTYPQGLLTGLASLENLDYHPQSCGTQKAREALAQYYARQEWELPYTNIVLTASTSEAYAFLMRLLVNPGEKVLIPSPSYPLFQFLLEINDVAFEYYPLVYEGQWRIDREALQALVDDQTKAIIVVNPNNPTGSYIDREELNFLNALCAKQQMALIVDEVFFEYPIMEHQGVSCVGNPEVLTFVLSGLSKTLALPQMKCAWILSSGPQDLVKEALLRLEIIADTYLSVNTPVQSVLPAWLAQAPLIQAQIISRVKTNLSMLREYKSPNVEILSLQGGWYATLRIPAVLSEEAWVLAFLKEDHVAVYPGYFFDFDREAYIVISLLPPPAVFKQALECLTRKWIAL